MEGSGESSTLGHHGCLQDFYVIVHAARFPEQCADSIMVLDNIISFWAKNKSMWFSHKPVEDFPVKYIRYSNDLQTNMSLILHYDQIFRHPSPDGKVLERNKPVAFRFASFLALHVIHCDQFASCEAWQKVFVLLTLRHNKSLKMKEFVLKKLRGILNCNGGGNGDRPDEATLGPGHKLYMRFLKATILDVNACKSSIGYREEDVSGATAKTGFQDILEPPFHRPFGTDDGSKRATVASLLKGFDEVSVHCKSSDKVAISISGGVDSMLCSFFVQEWCRLNGKTMVLLHICYNNRSCVDKEVLLLKWWARELGAPLYVRTIDEIKRQRNSSFRALYEECTRKIRFSFYKYFNCPIVLGHNRNDCYENIFSNLSRKIHFDDLVAMPKHSVEDGIVLLRPLLRLDKEHIFKYADGLEIPYLQDSTPAWSNRGKMRDVLIPQITSFNPAILEGLETFVQYSKFLASQWNQFFSQWCSNGGVVYGSWKNSIIITRDTFFSENYENVEFWVRVWFYMDLTTRPSNKSFTSVSNYIQEGKGGRFSLNGKYDALIESDKVICADKESLAREYFKGRPARILPKKRTTPG